jgi:LCP family protein required for cell wall assembly
VPEHSPAEHALPEVVGRSRRPLLVRVLVVLVLLVLVALVGLAALGPRLLPSETVAGLAPGRTPPRSEPLHVLIIGSDSRADLTPEERTELSTGSVAGERADTIMLLTVFGEHAGLLSFPRDLSVERCDGTVGRINAALAIGGPACLVETVHTLSGIRAHHHVAVTFGGFRDVVDAVGGVELCLDAPIRDRAAGIDLPAGCQVLDGADALGYVRVRKIDSDFARMERQQAFLRALAGELADPALIARPWRIPSVVGGFSQAVTVDDGLGRAAMTRLASGMRSLASGEAVTATVPSDGFTAPSGAMLLRVRDEEAAVLFAGFADGSALTPERIAGPAEEQDDED